MQNPEDISNPTTALDMALELMAKAFQLNNTTPTNNNQRSSSNPCNNQVAQSGMNIDQDRQMLMVDDNHGNGNAVAARAEGNGNGINGNLIKCYNSQGEGHYVSNYTVKLRKRDTDSDPVYDSDGSAEVHHSRYCYANDIFNMFTQEEQYTELLEPIPEPNQVQQNDRNVIFEVSSVEQDMKTVDQHPATAKETRAYFESLYNILAIEVEKVNLVNLKMKETNDDLTTELARYKNQEKCFEISQEKYEKLKRLQNFKIHFLKEASKFVRDFKSLVKEADESLAKHKALELEIERLLRAVVSQDIMSSVQSTPDPLPRKLENENVELEFQVQNYERENAHLKTAYKNIFDSINVTRAQTKTIIDSL
nr:hypothetical protein [Tanacetum cinerariifolium]